LSFYKRLSLQNTKADASLNTSAFLSLTRFCLNFNLILIEKKSLVLQIKVLRFISSINTKIILQKRAIPKPNFFENLSTKPNYL